MQSSVRLAYLTWSPTLFQDAPLDLYTDCFFESRRTLIESRLVALETCGPDEQVSIGSCCTIVSLSFIGRNFEEISQIEWHCSHFRFRMVHKSVSEIKHSENAPLA